MMRFAFVVGTVTLIVVGAWAAAVTAWVNSFDDSMFHED